jgi:predicted kinase
MTTRPTLFLTVGLPGTGKTTEARRIEVQEQALRLTKDEWVKALYGRANPPSASDVIEGRLIEIGLRALELRVNVVIDFGLWARDERSALRQAAADRGAAVEMRYLELPSAEQRRRLDRRQAEEPHTTWHMSDEELAEWAAIISVPTQGELDGSEPVDAPPGEIPDLGGVAQASLASVGPLTPSISSPQSTDACCQPPIGTHLVRQTARRRAVTGGET